MNLNWDKWGPLTVLIVALVVVLTVAGAVIVVVHPSTLTFDQLLKSEGQFLISLGVLGVGHSILGNQHAGDPSFQADLTDTKGVDDHPVSVVDPNGNPNA